MKKEKEIPELISQQEIAEIVARLGAEVSETYRDIEQELIVVGLLRGSFIFMADLIRAVNVPLIVDFMTVSSYGDGTVSSGDVKVVMDLDSSIEGRDVLVVDDIVDTGRTFSKVIRMLKNRNPKSIRTCSFLRKPKAHLVPIEIDFCGRSIGDEFVIGYGLDYAQKYRNIPYIGVLE